MASETPPAPGSAPRGPSKIPLLFGLLNTLGLFAAVGAVVYTRMLFERPKITESTERSARALQAEKELTAPARPAIIAFDPMTVNIRGGGEGSPKMHYVTLGFSLEVRDETLADSITEIKPLLLDRILHLLGNKAFHELNTVQGRYILRTEIQDMANGLVAERQPKTTDQRQPALVTSVYVTQFTLQ